MQGAYTKDALKDRVDNENRIKGNSDKLYAPDFIKDDDVALSKFEQLVCELKQADIIANVDIDLLAVYADAYSNYVKSTIILSMQPMVEEQENKLGAITKVQNPYIKIQQSYSAQLIKLASLFGLSPADRTRIAHINPSDKNEKDDPLMTLLSGMRSK